MKEKNKPLKWEKYRKLKWSYLDSEGYYKFLKQNGNLYEVSYQSS
ncbi:hypothetical protein OM075_06000 [Marinilabiliaceae bacterium AAT]|uniref:Uncharacterized protein n=1 Tax=Plebeiibacterium sediminum TaxID=2992112 RepID=A0AAE3M2D2_9BACT|nr:hypothetical protein [Plebeiobacterium sediminum]